MDLPFAVEDDLVEPLAVFIVIHVHFIAPVSLAALEALRRALDEWLAITRRASGRAGDAGDEPTGEMVQVGPQSVELQIHGAQGSPDVALPPLLRRLADLARTEPILRVEMD